MKLNGKAVMSLCLMTIVGLAVIKAFSWPFNTALFPVVIGIPVFFLAMNELWLSIAEGDKMAAGPSSAGAGHTRKESQPLPVSRTLRAFLLIVSFFFLILLVGFPAAAPLFVFLYLKVYGRERWGVSIVLSAVAGAGFYFLFIRLLNIPFEEGWIQQGVNILTSR
jgi:hypothetical protein